MLSLVPQYCQQTNMASNRDRNQDQTPPVKRRRTLNEKLAHGREKHPLKPPCDCNKKCIELINQRRRIAIYLEYRSLSYNDQKAFIHASVEQKETRQRRDSDREREVHIKKLYTYVI